MLSGIDLIHSIPSPYNCASPPPTLTRFSSLLRPSALKQEVQQTVLVSEGASRSQTTAHFLSHPGLVLTVGNNSLFSLFHFVDSSLRMSSQGLPPNSFSAPRRRSIESRISAVENRSGTSYSEPMNISITPAHRCTPAKTDLAACGEHGGSVSLSWRRRASTGPLGASD